MREKMQKNLSLIFGHVFIFAHATTKCHFLIRKIFCTKHYVKRQKEQDFYGDWIEFLFLFFPLFRYLLWSLFACRKVLHLQ